MTAATRISDGERVKLKRISTSSSCLEEVEISQYLASEPHGSLEKNHCLKMLDVLATPEDPDHVLIVMPYLLDWEKPKFDTIGEAVEFFRQMFEVLQNAHCQSSHANMPLQGLEYMHSLDIAHKYVNFKQCGDTS